jgi:hypothetical protein
MRSHGIVPSFTLAPQASAARKTNQSVILAGHSLIEHVVDKQAA